MSEWIYNFKAVTTTATNAAISNDGVRARADAGTEPIPMAKSNTQLDDDVKVP
jgi:hypothetical protein